MDYSIIGERIKQERLNNGLTQEVLAEKANISTSFLGQIERGERKLSLVTLIQIAKVLGASLDYLVSDYSPREKPELDELIYLLRNHSRQEIRMIIDISKTVFKYCDK
ncbi:helix-turn-helix domain-containing protein [Desulfosporosinus orientis]|uniref:helix-turn-helix domain-containing protein n=1 Tax=Desulfosporosinus orientis TaxID=1563 RepID=UPI000317FBE4|nr:helix-turn-helix transcriptional regulator [Desulfosporosinus orientis]